MSRLVERGPATLSLGDHDAPLGTEHDLLEGVGEVAQLDCRVGAARGQQRGLVDQVAQVGADHARGGGRDRGEVDVAGERHRAGVHFQDAAAAVLVGRCDGDAPVEATGAQQRGVEDLRAVGGGEHDDAFVAGEAVHLGEDLIERLLALVVSAHARTRAAAGTADRVELVDEHDRRRRLLRS